MWPMSELTTYQMSMAIIKAGVKKWRGSKRLSEVKRSKAETGLMYRSINLWRAGVTVITKIDKVEGCTTVCLVLDSSGSYDVFLLYFSQVTVHFNLKMLCNKENGYQCKKLM